MDGNPVPVGLDVSCATIQEITFGRQLTRFFETLGSKQRSTINHTYEIRPVVSFFRSDAFRRRVDLAGWLRQ